MNARKAKGITQAKVASGIGMTAQFFGKIDKGDVELPLRFAKKFCKITGTKGDDLIKAKVQDFKNFCDNRVKL